MAADQFGDIWCTGYNSNAPGGTGTLIGDAHGQVPTDVTSGHLWVLRRARIN